MSKRQTKKQTAKLDQKGSAKYLRSAQRLLVCRVDPQGGKGGHLWKVTPYISEIERGWEEVIREGYDPYHSPLGCPVYWRVVSRGDEQLYCSTFLATRDQVIKGWGMRGIAHCDPVTGMAFARIETIIRTGDTHQ